MNEQGQGQLNAHQRHAQLAGHDRVGRRLFLRAYLGLAAFAAAACAPAILGPTAGAAPPGVRPAEETPHPPPRPTRIVSTPPPTPPSEAEIKNEYNTSGGQTFDVNLGERFFDGKGELKEEFKPFLSPTAQAWEYKNGAEVAQDLKNPATAFRLIATAAFSQSGASYVLRSGPATENMVAPIKLGEPIVPFAGFDLFRAETKNGRPVMIMGGYKDEETEKRMHTIVVQAADGTMTDSDVSSAELQKMLPEGWSYSEESETGQPTISRIEESEPQDGTIVRTTTKWKENKITKEMAEKLANGALTIEEFLNGKSPSSAVLFRNSREEIVPIGYSETNTSEGVESGRIQVVYFEGGINAGYTVLLVGTEDPKGMQRAVIPIIVGKEDGAFAKTPFFLQSGVEPTMYEGAGRYEPTPMNPPELLDALKPFEGLPIRIEMFLTDYSKRLLEFGLTDPNATAQYVNNFFPHIGANQQLFKDVPALTSSIGKVSTIGELNSSQLANSPFTFSTIVPWGGTKTKP